MSTPETSGRRLDSWKAVAEYLARDVATVRRWERQGLPVHRVPGGERRAVFAYTLELDHWLRGGDGRNAADAVTLPADAAAPLAAVTSPRRRRHWLLASAVGATAVAGLLWWTQSAASTPGLVVTTTSDAVIASAGGAERWRFPFAPDLRIVFPTFMTEPSRVAREAAPAVYVAVGNQIRRADEASLGGVLLDLDAQGRRRRSFSFTDRVTVAGGSYDPPWGITWCDLLDRPAGRRLAVSAHHMVWSASLVTILDEQFERHGTFTHNGWIEFVEWLGPDRLVVGGYSDDKRGGMIGLLDARALDGPPIRLVVMPRSDVNLAAGARFNRAVIQRTPDRLLARTIEVPEDGPRPAADIIYEFTMDLDLVSVAPGSRFEELQKQLPHPATAFPVMIWEPRTGWTSRLARR